MDVTALQAQFIRSYWALIFVALGAASLAFFVGQSKGFSGKAFITYCVMLAWSLACRLAARFSRRWAITALAIGIIPMLAVFLSTPAMLELLEVRTVGRLSFGAPSTLLMGVVWGWPGALVSILVSLLTLGWDGSSAELITGATLLALVGFSGSSVGQLIKRLEEANRRLSEAATVDAMTGLGNRRKLENLPRLEGEWMVTMWDVDGLKRVNDSQGHAAGDQYLLAFSRALESATAANDQLFRIGGDEFMGVHQNYADAAALEARVKRNFPNVSMGWAMVEGRELPSVMFEADSRLYAVKHARTESATKPIPLVPGKLKITRAV
jgi:diguanylate cyclase (GGDEF)-like protein